MATLTLLPLLLLIVLAVAVVVASERMRVPYTIALVGMGVLLGLLGGTPQLHPVLEEAAALFNPSLFFDVLLPPIVFEAAIHVNFKFLRARAGVILFLVFVGVLLTALFTGVVLAELQVLPLGAALLMAAILSPTDPIAIVDLFKRVRVPRELATIVESESLLNDAVGVILFTVVLDAMETGQFGAFPALLQFLWLAGGGAAIGLLVAGGVYLLHRELHDPPVETALTVVAAYGSFLLASSVGASGIVSTAIAGIAVGTYVAPRAMDPDVRHSVVTFWNVVVYLANSIIFLAMGILFEVSSLVDYLDVILVAFAVLFLGRTLAVYAHYPVATRVHGPSGRLPRSWYNVLTLSGVRGALPIVLVLGLLTAPTGLSPGNLRAVVAGVLGVAFISVVVSNIAAEWYVRRNFGKGASGGEPPPGDGGGSPMDA